MDSRGNKWVVTPISLTLHFFLPSRKTHHQPPSLTPYLLVTPVRNDTLMDSVVIRYVKAKWGSGSPRNCSINELSGDSRPVKV